MPDKDTDISVVAQDVKNIYAEWDNMDKLFTDVL